MIENDQPNLHFLLYKYSMDSRFSEEVSVYSLQPEHYYFIVRYSMNQPHGIIYKGMFLENDESIQFNNTLQINSIFTFVTNERGINIIGIQTYQNIFVLDEEGETVATLSEYRFFRV